MWVVVLGGMVHWGADGLLVVEMALLQGHSHSRGIHSAGGMHRPIPSVGIGGS
jgi:hypothetical protein